MTRETLNDIEEYSHNSTYPKGRASCSADTFEGIKSSVLRMNPDSYRDGKSPALRVAANRQTV